MPRTTYHHGDLREAMIQAALRLVESKGLRGFSMREAAREAGVAPSAPYRHFADKTALMTAVAEVALKELLERTEAALDGLHTPEPLEQFRATGLAYVQFAYERPAPFRVLHDPEYAQSENSPTLTAYRARGDALIQGILASASSEGAFSPELGVDLLEFTASTLLYGMARRIVDGQLDPSMTWDQVRDLAFLTTQVLGAGIIPRS